MRLCDQDSVMLAEESVDGFPLAAVSDGIGGEKGLRVPSAYREVSAERVPPRVGGVVRRRGEVRYWRGGCNVCRGRTAQSTSDAILLQNHQWDVTVVVAKGTNLVGGGREV